MKKYNYYLLLLLSLLATFTQAQPNERLVFWVHGLGGTQLSWSRAAAASESGVPGTNFGARRLKSINTDYSVFNNAIDIAARQLHNNFLLPIGNQFMAENGLTNRNNNFIIAHSQGGIVSRQLDKLGVQEPWNFNRMFGGIVTFGTPHLGAQILNNKQKLIDELNLGCDAFGGVLAQEIGNNTLTSLGGFQRSINQFVDGTCGFLTNNIVPIALGSSINAPIGDDYKVGASVLNDLNNFHSSNFAMNNRVAFFGVEEKENLLWRQMTSFIVRNPEQQPAFQANIDDDLITLKNQFKSTLTTKLNETNGAINFYTIMGMPCGFWGWTFNTSNCVRYDAAYWRAINRRNAYQTAINWLDNINGKYKRLIGAFSSPTPVEVLQYECQCDVYDSDLQNVVSTYTGYTDVQGDCSVAAGGSIYNSCFATNADPIVTYLSGGPEEEEDSDGVVIAESAKGFPGAQTAIMNGSNHQQMRNDSNTKDRLIELYNGQYGSYFFTTPR
jgi:hypothetical protein